MKWLYLAMVNSENATSYYLFDHIEWRLQSTWLYTLPCVLNKACQGEYEGFNRAAPGLLLHGRRVFEAKVFEMSLWAFASELRRSSPFLFERLRPVIKVDSTTYSRLLFYFYQESRALLPLKLLILYEYDSIGQFKVEYQTKFLFSDS